MLVRGLLCAPLPFRRHWRLQRHQRRHVPHCHPQEWRQHPQHTALKWHGVSKCSPRSRQNRNPRQANREQRHTCPAAYASITQNVPCVHDDFSPRRRGNCPPSAPKWAQFFPTRETCASRHVHHENQWKFAATTTHASCKHPRRPRRLKTHSSHHSETSG